jgi:hypothetical protein
MEFWKWENEQKNSRYGKRCYRAMVRNREIEVIEYLHFVLFHEPAGTEYKESNRLKEISN